VDAGTPYCANEQTDNANCGACGHTCGPQQSCSRATCTSSCITGQTLCSPDGGAVYCADESADNNNCGACGKVCGAQQVCSGGMCTSSCVTGQTLCSPDGGAPYCADESTDNNNCGGCGHVCGAGLGCSGGSCVTVCGGGTQLCGAVCSDVQSDPSHCGNCMMACSAGQVCSAGACATLCAAGLTDCGGACVDEQTDSRNCGGCGHVCQSGGTCTNSECPPYIYTASFTNGVTPAAQCTAWQSYTAGLATSGYTTMNVRGTSDPVGISCTDAVIVPAMASALLTGASYTAACNGHTWSNCSRYSDELWIDPPAQCSNSNCPAPGYILRPCIGNPNWGGVDTATCASPSQTMVLTFQ
jgi:hypothetical protein